MRLLWGYYPFWGCLSVCKCVDSNGGKSIDRLPQSSL